MSTKVFQLEWMKELFQYTLPYKRIVIRCVICSVILAIITPVRPWLIQHTINNYIAKGLVNMMVYATLFQIGILMIETGLKLFFSYWTSWLGQSIVRDLREDIYSHIIHLQIRQFHKTPIGIFTTRTIDDIERVSDIFSDGLIPILTDVLSIFCIVGYMLYVNAMLTLLCLLPFLLLLVGTYYFKNSVNKSFHGVRNAVAKLNVFVQEHLSGMLIIQAFAVQEQELKKFKAINQEHRQENIRAIFAYSVFFPLVEIIFALSIGLIVWKSASSDVNPGTVVAFILCLNLLIRPLRIIADKFNVVQMGAIAAKRVFEISANQDHYKDELG